MSEPAKITKNIEKRVSFSNEQVRDMLQKAAGAPADAKGTIKHDDDSFYGDLEIVWWTQEVTELQP
jgi:DNA-directed RNA polymerase sigma subunit (sigma70/sigma32)